MYKCLRGHRVSFLLRMPRSGLAWVLRQLCVEPLERICFYPLLQFPIDSPAPGMSFDKGMSELNQRKKLGIK